MKPTDNSQFAGIELNNTVLKTVAASVRGLAVNLRKTCRFAETRRAHIEKAFDLLERAAKEFEAAARRQT